MKLLKSKCERAWFFDSSISNGFLNTGLACFLPGCEESIDLEVKQRIYRIWVPKEAVCSPVPVKVSNARLSLLVSAPHE